MTLRADMLKRITEPAKLRRHVRGERLSLMRYVRQCNGLTACELAQVLDLSPETVSRMETGARPTTDRINMILCMLLDREDYAEWRFIQRQRTNDLKILKRMAKKGTDT